MGSEDGDWTIEIKRCLLLGRKAVTNLDSVLKSKEIILPTKFHIVKAMFISVAMYECESLTIKNSEHQRTDALELRCWRRLESLLDRKEIKPVNLKGDKHWIFIGRTHAEAETVIFWPPDAKNWKSLFTGKDWCLEDWRQKEKEAAED